MKREVDLKRARIAWDFLQLPYVTRATLMKEFAFPGGEPHEEVLSELLDRLTSEGRLEEFGERVRKYQKYHKPQDGGGMTFSDVPDYPPEIAALAKAAEPLLEYLLEHGDPHTCVVVTRYGATVKQDTLSVPFAKHVRISEPLTSEEIATRLGEAFKKASKEETT